MPSVGNKLLGKVKIIYSYHSTSLSGNYQAAFKASPPPSSCLRFDHCFSSGVP